MILGHLTAEWEDPRSNWMVENRYFRASTGAGRLGALLGEPGGTGRNDDDPRNGDKSSRECAVGVHGVTLRW